MFSQEPGTPWVKGRPPWQDLTQTKEHVAKRAASMKKRVEEQGPTTAELEGYKKLSETRKRKKIRPSSEAIAKISAKLTGAHQPWRENKSRASCRLNSCDIVYVLRVKTKEGEIFGKWGSSKESTFKFREREFIRKGFTWEILFWSFFGEETENAEAFIGRALSKHPWKHSIHFYGHTETFGWNAETEKLLGATLNALEENPSP